MTQHTDQNSPASTVQEYVAACLTGSVERLESIFHPNAVMSGYFQGEFYLGSPVPFFDEVRDNPSPSETGAAYSAEITTVEVSGDVASVTLKEDGYLGTRFTNWFHLVRLDGRWIIISKAYQDD